MEYYTEFETANVLAEAKRTGKREHCMFLLGYWHGLRASEIAGLTVTDVQGGAIDVRRLKGSQHTIQPLREDERRVLAAWLRERGDGDGSQFLFTSKKGSGLSRQQVYNLFYGVAMRAGIDRARRHPHLLKHTQATHLYQHGVGLVDIQMLMGHAHISSTVRYTHVTQSEAAAKAHAALPANYA